MTLNERLENLRRDAAELCSRLPANMVIKVPVTPRRDIRAEKEAEEWLDLLVNTRDVNYPAIREQVKAILIEGLKEK